MRLPQHRLLASQLRQMSLQFAWDFSKECLRRVIFKTTTGLFTPHLTAVLQFLRNAYAVYWAGDQHLNAESMEANTLCVSS